MMMIIISKQLQDECDVRQRRDDEKPYEEMRRIRQMMWKWEREMCNKKECLSSEREWKKAAAAAERERERESER